MIDRLDPTRRSRAPFAVACLSIALLVPFATGPVAADRSGTPLPSDPSAYQTLPGSEGYDGSYSYVRVLEGSATLLQGESGVRDQLQVNQPILVGDRVWVAPRGRLELVLSDRNLLRIDAGSEVVFEALAGSPDRQDPLTVIRLLEGNLQIVIADDFLGNGLPRIDTPNATVYAVDYGTVRVTADGTDWTEVVAREGSAEVVTRNGSLMLHEDERAIVEGERRPVERIERAGRLDALEIWGARLDREARYAQAPYVDESIRYEASSLNRYGSWVSIDGRSAWRPRVSVEWRPYWNGRWSHSPLGYTWISYEPWGWVPYHYGTWDYVPGYGWSWFPGAHFAPAWVYWYWTDLYVGWVPVGYYTRYYHPYFGLDVGFRFGTYGWAGGHWSNYRYWNFCDLDYFGRGQQHHHVYGGDRFGDSHGYAVPRRGLVTTDTRGLPRDIAVERGRAVEILATRTRTARGNLPDVTPFVARERQLDTAIRDRVLVERGGERARGASVLPTPGVEDAVRRALRSDGANAVSNSRVRVETDRAGELQSIRRGLPETRTPQTRSDARTDAGIATVRGRSPEVDRGAATRGRVVEQELTTTRTRTASPEGPGAAAPRRDAAVSDRSWRERAPAIPDRTTRDRGTAGRPDSSTVRRPQTDPRSSPDRGTAVRDRQIDRGRNEINNDRTSVPRRVIEGVRDHRERSRTVREPERSPTSTRRSESSSPPPRSRTSSVSDRTSSRRRSSSVERRSSPVERRSTSVDRRSSPVERRSTSVDRRSSSGRRSAVSSRSSSRSSSSSSRSSSGSKGRTRSKGKPPA